MLGSWLTSSVLSPTQSEHSKHRDDQATRIFVSSQDRSFCTRRISIRPCFQIENGMRQSVFSFRLAQPALFLDRAHYLAHQVLRSLFQQTDCGGRLVINDHSLDTREAPL